MTKNSTVYVPNTPYIANVLAKMATPPRIAVRHVCLRSDVGFEINPNFLADERTPTVRNADAAMLTIPANIAFDVKSGILPFKSRQTDRIPRSAPTPP